MFRLEKFRILGIFCVVFCNIFRVFREGFCVLLSLFSCCGRLKFRKSGLEENLFFVFRLFFFSLGKSRRVVLVG